VLCCAVLCCLQASYERQSETLEQILWLLSENFKSWSPPKPSTPAQPLSARMHNGIGISGKGSQQRSRAQHLEREMTLTRTSKTSDNGGRQGEELLCDANGQISSPVRPQQFHMKVEIPHRAVATNGAHNGRKVERSGNEPQPLRGVPTVERSGKEPPLSLSRRIASP
jgi:hypothetical protein